MPIIKQETEIFLKNGTKITGLLMSWEDNQCSLLTKDNFLIEIFDVLNNVILTKTVNPQFNVNTESSESLSFKNNEEEMSELKKRALQLASSKVDETTKMRELIASNLRNTEIKPPTNNIYEPPDFSKLSA